MSIAIPSFDPAEYHEGYSFGQGDLPENIHECEEINIVESGVFSQAGTPGDLIPSGSCGFGFDDR